MLGTASKIFLFPYWCILRLRNYLYDKQYFKSERFPIPVVAVGNITVGGTGKTPHTEMVVGELKSRFKIAVVSRGYKRKTKGFRIVNVEDDFTTCGDEPLQIKRKFPDVIVAVCKDRGYAIRKLIKDYGVNFVVLDDAFQYRKIIPSVSVLLVDYNRSIVGDNLIPIGRLRDLPSQIGRADIVIVTKSPKFGEIEGAVFEQPALEETAVAEKKWRKNLCLRPHQKLYFSSTVTLPAQPVFAQVCDMRYLYSQFAVAFTGIANDYGFRSQLVATHQIQEILKFSDHKNFSKCSVRKIKAMVRRLPECAVMTTEKDSMRLLSNKYLSEEVKKRLFYLPIEAKISSAGKREEFFNEITGVGLKNS